MELYVHIPFCRQKCRYCDFASWSDCERQMPRYVDALLREAQACAPAAARMDTVFLGGGTPSLLPPEELCRLLTGLQAIFDIAPHAEFTSEANPGTLTPQWLDAAVKGGMNRLSMGMQALQPELLRTLGRIHNFDQVKDSVRMAREAGVANLSLDLMFGLPGQTPAMWRETLNAALSLSPEHLSCYGLIPEEGTPLVADLEAGRLTLPDEDAEREMYDDTLRILASHGFQQYEISNFAKPGYACRHNLGYWQQVPYIGLGAAAASCMPGSKDCAYVRLANPSDLMDYLRMAEQSDWTQRENESITRADAQYETLMLGLRTTQGVSEAAYEAMHGAPLLDRYGSALHRLEQQGLLIHEDGWWRLTRRGMDVQNAVLVDLMDN